MRKRLQIFIFFVTFLFFTNSLLWANPPETQPDGLPAGLRVIVLDPRFRSAISTRVNWFNYAFPQIEKIEIIPILSSGEVRERLFITLEAALKKGGSRWRCRFLVDFEEEVFDLEAFRRTVVDRTSLEDGREILKPTFTFSMAHAISNLFLDDAGRTEPPIVFSLCPRMKDLLNIILFSEEFSRALELSRQEFPDGESLMIRAFALDDSAGNASVTQHHSIVIGPQRGGAGKRFDFEIHRFRNGGISVVSVSFELNGMVGEDYVLDGSRPTFKQTATALNEGLGTGDLPIWRLPEIEKLSNSFVGEFIRAYSDPRNTIVRPYSREEIAMRLRQIAREKFKFQDTTTEAILRDNHFMDLLYQECRSDRMGFPELSSALFRVLRDVATRR